MGLIENLRWYGIQNPEGDVWWVTNKIHDSWMAFFTYPSNKGKLTLHRLCIADAISAYKGIGYKCVELKLEVIKEINNEYELENQVDPSEKGGE